MNTRSQAKSNSWGVHAAIILVRVLIGVLVWGSMPVAHALWGEPYPGDGQKGFGMIMAFALVSGCAMLAYFLVTSVLHYILRRKGWRFIAGVDGGLGVLLVIVLIFAGVTATYTAEPIPVIHSATPLMSRNSSIMFTLRMAQYFKSDGSPLGGRG